MLLINLFNGEKIYTVGNLHMHQPTTLITLGGLTVAELCSRDIVSVHSVPYPPEKTYYLKVSSDGEEVDRRGLTP